MRQVLILTLILNSWLFIKQDAYSQSKESSLDVLDEDVKRISDGLEAYSKRIDSKFALFAHRRTFVIPFSYVENPSDDIYRPLERSESNTHEFYTHQEAEFQLSFFLPVYRHILKSKWDFMVAYTHHSWWQVYNAYRSKPFRETNYNPELFFRNVLFDKVDILGLTVFGLDLGYMHESNGQIQLVSKSWDRIFARTHFLKGSLNGIITTWIRIPEKRRDDDNHTILDYKGFGKIELNKAFGKLTLSGEANLAAKLGIEASASYPWNDYFRWFVKVNRGYGQSLIEYDRNTTRYGIGISLEGYGDSSE